MRVIAVVAVIVFLFAALLPWALVDYWAQIHRDASFEAGCVIHSIRTFG